MAILGIGVDVLHSPRIAAILRRGYPARFAARILSREEFAQWESLPTSDMSRRVRFLAVRWCVKEAAYKALYPNLRPTWKELTYRRLCPGNGGMKPALLYHPIMAVEANKKLPLPPRPLAALRDHSSLNEILETKYRYY